MKPLSGIPGYHIPYKATNWYKGRGKNKLQKQHTFKESIEGGKPYAFAP